MSQELLVPHTFLVQATLVRGRKARWLPFRGEVPVQIAEAASFESPRALVLGKDRAPVRGAGAPRWAGTRGPRKSTWAKGNREIGPSGTDGMERVRDVFGGHGGRIYRPLRPPRSFYDPVDVALLARGSNDEDFRDHPFVSWRGRKFFDRTPERDAAAEARFKVIHVDGEEDARRRVAMAAADLLIVDGALHRVQEHAFVVSLSSAGGDRRVEVSFERPLPYGKVSGVHFPADRKDEAVDFARSLASALAPGTPGGARPRVTVSDVEVDEVDPAFTGIDVPRLTARALVNAAHDALTSWSPLALGDGDAEPGDELRAAALESLGGRYPYRAPHMMGDPFDLAERLAERADEIRTLPRRTRASEPPVCTALDDLVAPLRHAREMGYAPSSEGLFLPEVDLSGFSPYADEDAETEAFAP